MTDFPGSCRNERSHHLIILGQRNHGPSAHKLMKSGSCSATTVDRGTTLSFVISTGAYPDFLLRWFVFTRRSTRRLPAVLTKRSTNAATTGLPSLGFRVIPGRGIAMKKCPNCYAIMRETEKPNQIPGLPQLPSEEHPSNDVATVRYECSQCGHCEDSFPLLSRTSVYR